MYVLGQRGLRSAFELESRLARLLFFSFWFWSLFFCSVFCSWFLRAFPMFFLRFAQSNLILTILSHFILASSCYSPLTSLLSIHRGSIFFISQGYISAALVETLALLRVNPPNLFSNVFRKPSLVLVSLRLFVAHYSLLYSAAPSFLWYFSIVTIFFGLPPIYDSRVHSQ